MTRQGHFQSTAQAGTGHGGHDGFGTGFNQIYDINQRWHTTHFVGIICRRNNALKLGKFRQVGPGREVMRSSRQNDARDGCIVTSGCNLLDQILPQMGRQGIQQWRTSRRGRLSKVYDLTRHGGSVVVVLVEYCRSCMVPYRP
eukprot:scaffold4003_cov165-Amphora_coffeaeformis.AAC.9